MTSTPTQAGLRFAGIDGLRAYAVLAVIASHAHVPWMAGGGVGVDMFFGISGFLITFLLLREGERFGQISLGKFWLRRLLRLYPALIVLLVVVDAMALVIVHFRPNADFGDALGATPSVLFYFANWMIVGTQSAFLGPLGPLWSLSVEEQFYLVWPLIVVLALRLPRTKTVLASIAGAVTIGAVTYRFSTFRAENLFQTFGTEFRVDMLLTGVLLAIAFRAGGELIIQRASSILVAPGALYLAVVSVVVPRFGQPGSASAEQIYYTWGLPFVALSTAALIGYLVTHQQSRAVRVLSWRPLDYSGRISYGLYLWHYPIIFFIGSALTVDPNLVLVASLIATYLVAALSWKLIERPLQRRFHDRLRPAAREPRPVASQSSRPA